MFTERGLLGYVGMSGNVVLYHQLKSGGGGVYWSDFFICNIQGMFYISIAQHMIYSYANQMQIKLKNTWTVLSLLRHYRDGIHVDKIVCFKKARFNNFFCIEICQLPTLFNKFRRSRLNYRSINYLQIIIVTWVENVHTYPGVAGSR